MSIVFDEVATEIASIPEPRDIREASQPMEPPAPSRSMQEEFRHWQRREDRLHAD